MFGHDNQDNDDSDQITPVHFGNQDDHNDQGGQGGQQAVDTNEADSAAASTSSVADETQTTPTVDQVILPAPAATDDLLTIKQEALQALTPLVGQLDQTPEEQFRTTMMMIQASDNHELVRVAYEAAKKISIEKDRAQALLDIVNEINYFTQHTQA